MYPDFFCLVPCEGKRRGSKEAKVLRSNRGPFCKPTHPPLLIAFAGGKAHRMDYLAFLDSFTSPAVAAGVTVPSAPASRPFAPVSSALDKPGGRDDPSRIKIVVRIRPSLPGEACALPDGSSVLSCSDPTTPDGQPSVSITCPGSEPKSLTFHDVFGPSAGQTAVFEGSVLACVQSALDGVNATVFAYGCVLVLRYIVLYVAGALLGQRAQSRLAFLLGLFHDDDIVLACPVLQL